jgi:hypothetical protein
MQVMFDLHANIQYEFNAAGVQIMSPHCEADPERPRIVPPGQYGGERGEARVAQG